MNGFIFLDGFGGGKFGKPIASYEPYFGDSSFICHLHSSYRIGYRGEELIKTKLRWGEKNMMPILVYMNPVKKLSYIRKHYILRRYWESFERWLNLADEIVVYGNSLNGDPHIVDLLNREGSRRVNKPRIYAAGRSPDKMLQQLMVQ